MNTENIPATIPQNETVELSIPQEKIDLISALAELDKKWIKLTEGGFVLAKDEKFLPELVGVIRQMRPYYVRWSTDNKTPEKIEYSGQPAPEGFDLRCDLTLEIDGALYGLSLAKSSTKHHLAAYTNALKKNGLKPDQVVTRIRSKSITTSNGKFSIAIFEPVSGIGAPIQKPEPIKPVVDVTPRPQQQATASNPWA